VCRGVAIAPLAPLHAADLLALSEDPDAWRLMPRPPFSDLDDARGFIAAAHDEAQDGSSVPFAILRTDAGTERCVGTTRFLAIERPHRRLEIGWTMLAPTVRGTHVNPAAKYLLLQHAFDELGARRVELKTDAENARSRRAIERLGATFEGIFRKHRIRPDGSNRDTAWYAILDDDWPAVRARLLTRLQG
jgi:RimJ/RimL family protein N-acetyltransferase